jgi:type IV fimbrial biogenesis protein FimT
MNMLNLKREDRLGVAHRPSLAHSGTGRIIRRHTQRGWTLVEGCAGLAVAAILAGSAVSSFSGVINRKKLEVKSGQLLADLHYLRSEVVSRNEGLRISFGQDDGGSCYVLHSGSADQCQCSSSGQASCQDPNSRVLKSVAMPQQNGITITHNVASIHFDPRLGTSSPAGTVRMVDKQGRSIHHVVSIRGRVRTCSVRATLPNVPKC